MNNSKEKVILDVDPGADDAIAMMYAYLSDKLHVKLVSVVGGNVGIDQATLNALFITENFASYNVPVVKGSGKSLKVTHDHKLTVHGKKGLGDIIEVESTNLKEINTPTFGASEAIKKVLEENKGQITYVCLGPSTNLALALRKYPEIKENIKRVVIMGSSIDGSGSITPYSGFNLYCDPEACAEVVATGLPILFSPKEMGLSAYITPAMLNRWEKFGRAGEMVKKIYGGYRDLLLPSTRRATHDLCAVMSLTRPELFKTKNVDISINTSMDIKRGQTLFKDNKESNISLQYKCDRKKILQELEDILKKAD